MLTVAQQALFVKLGTGNQIQSQSSTQYAQPYSVLVTDANGNAVGDAVVELEILSIQYRKGQYLTSTIDPSALGCQWVLSDSLLIVDPTRRLPIITCNNEDLNLNGILDSGEDINHNGILDPGNVATPVPSIVTTDATGFGFFAVVYAKEFAGWVQVEVRARTVVAGSETLSQESFFLLGLSSDFSACKVSPPAQLSPFGTFVSGPPDPCTTTQ